MPKKLCTNHYRPLLKSWPCDRHTRATHVIPTCGRACLCSGSSSLGRCGAAAKPQPLELSTAIPSAGGSSGIGAAGHKPLAPAVLAHLHAHLATAPLACHAIRMLCERRHAGSVRSGGRPRCA